MAALDDLTNAGLPIPSIYTSEAASADDAYQKALAAIGSKQAQLAQQFGFAIQTDPNTGALQDTRIDPNQQFSQVMNLLNAHSQGLHNLRESLSGAGLTGGGMKGLAAQRAALLRFQQQGQVAGLGSNFAGQFGDLTNQRAGALATRNQGYNQAAQDAINFAIQNGWFNQAAPAAPPSGGSSGSPGEPPNTNNAPFTPTDVAPPMPGPDGGGGLMGAAATLSAQPFLVTPGSTTPSQIRQTSNMLTNLTNQLNASNSPVASSGAAGGGTNYQARRNSF